MWTSTVPSCAESSTPEMISSPVPSARARASSSPSTESWSVSASADSPLERARSTIAVGVCVPSECSEWLWRSAGPSVTASSSAPELADLRGDVGIVGLGGEDGLELLERLHRAAARLEHEPEAVAERQRAVGGDAGQRE